MSHPDAEALLVDRRFRPLRRLRLSLTDRCNFRCAYCMPKAHFGPGHAFLPSAARLSGAELVRVVSVAWQLGVRHFKLTGGEPLLRPDIIEVVETIANRLSCLSNEKKHAFSLSMTTNGSRLNRYAKSLRQAGLQRLTVSLDAIDDTLFRQLNDMDIGVESVLEGIATANAHGFSKININVVVQRQVNEQAVLALAEFGRTNGHTVRFIEFMDVGNVNQWSRRALVSSAEVHAMLHAQWPLEAIAPRAPGEVANRWRYQDGGGEIGLISSVSTPFCQDCDRARLSADGVLYPCLFATQGLDLKPWLRSTSFSEVDTAKVIANYWAQRDDQYSVERDATASQPIKIFPKIEMSYIGG